MPNTYHWIGFLGPQKGVVGVLLADGFGRRTAVVGGFLAVGKLASASPFPISS